MEIKGFAPETVETAGLTPAEETTDNVGSEAIEVTEGQGVSVFEEQVGQLPTSVPRSLMINGVEINNDTLKKVIKEEVLTMTINGLGDKAGYDNAVAKLKELSKTRTGSKSWYTKVTKPINKLKSDLLKQITETETLCSEGEKYLTDIIEPIKNAQLIAIQKAEEAKDLLAVERAAELVKLGGVFDGQGTYNFPYDADLFVLQESLRELAPEAYAVKLDEIQASFEIEQKRLQAIEDAKVNEANALKGKVEDLNAERTEMRVENLELKGFEFDGVSVFTKGDLVITEDQILNLDKDAWKELLNPTLVIQTPGTHVVYNGAAQGFSPESPSPHAEPAQAPSLGDSIVSDFAGFAPATPVEEQPVVETEKVMTRTLVFSEAKPFISFAVGTDYTMHVFPNEYAGLFNFTAEVLTDGTMNDQLQFKLTENAGA